MWVQASVSGERAKEEMCCIALNEREDGGMGEDKDACVFLLKFC